MPEKYYSVKIIFFFFFLSFLYPFILPAQVKIVLNDDHEHIRIGESVYYLKDPGQKLTFEQITSPEYDKQFIKCGKPAPNFGNVQLAIWNKFTVVNISSKKKWLLVVDNYSIDTLTFYYPDSSGVYRQIKSGRSRPYSTRKYKTNLYVFDLPVKPGDSSVFYVKVETYLMQYPLIIASYEKFVKNNHDKDLLEGMYFGFLLLIILYNTFIYITVRDKNYLYYLTYVVLNGLMVAELQGITAPFWSGSFDFMWNRGPTIVAVASIMVFIFTKHFLETKKHVPRLHKVINYFFIPVLIFTILLNLLNLNLAASVLNQLIGFFGIPFMYTLAIKIYRKGYLPARFYITACCFYFAGVVVYILKSFAILPFNNFTNGAIEIGSGIEMMLFSLALADKINVYKKEKENARMEALNSLRENERLILEQKKLLEVKVKERTAELEETLSDLKNTQVQLVQSEKLASLGQLTAGIAHEIKNPLNFINNFSELSMDLVDELKQPESKEDQSAILDELHINLARITHHGKRADSIVKNMLDHVRLGKAEQSKTPLNLLVEEYISLAYQGVRANDASFICTLKREFDENIKDVLIIQAEIGRVILNIANNAFYAVKEKKNKSGKDYEPIVSIKTEMNHNMALIKIKDNGTGIPSQIRDKIFDPFFTTKPTGEGTGLGLSLCFDMIKSNGGTLSVESEEGVFTEFVIALPN